MSIFDQNGKRKKWFISIPAENLLLFMSERPWLMIAQMSVGLQELLHYHLVEQVGIDVYPKYALTPKGRRAALRLIK